MNVSLLALFQLLLYSPSVAFHRATSFPFVWQQSTRRMVNEPSGGKNDQLEQQFVSMHKSASDNVSQQHAVDEKNHLQNQQRLFNDLADCFGTDDVVPVEIIRVYKHLALLLLTSMKQERERGITLRNVRNFTEHEANPDVYRVLDVACGAGVLFDFLMEAADTLDIKLHIVGLDLADKMIQKAAEKADSLKPKYGDRHSVDLECADVGTYIPQKPIDAIVMNACWGAFWSPTSILYHLSEHVQLDGVIAITHPLGADFVRKLHENDPKSVPHVHPTQEELGPMTLLAPLEPLLFVEEYQSHDNASPPRSIYYASCKRVRHRALHNLVRLRGNIDSGYGRGGKKLGFPTANLPSRLFQDALERVPAGVYLGWALLENTPGEQKKGRDVIHKAVVNVGFSPTFEGQENREKIVEAHFMLEDGVSLDPPDFYGEPCRLQLHAFLRPEIKFPSFPALIAQIKTDVEDAKIALDKSYCLKLRSGTFFDVSSGWIGQDGGDSIASWEFVETHSVLSNL